jgi:hypothetical protein
MIETFVDQSRNHRHPFYKIMELGIEELQTELQSWERNELIEWLRWNDKNGVYDDEQSLREFGHILEKNEAIKIIINQIHSNN